MKPDWGRLPADYLRAATGSGGGVSCKDVSERYASLSAGRILRFRLRANATEKRGTALKSERQAGEHRNGRRVPLPQEELVAWLIRKGEVSGFRPVEVAARRGELPAPAVRTLRPPDVHGWRRSVDGAPARRLSFSPALFEGILEVTDPDRFKSALERGIGPAKGYGFGLLSIRRPDRSGPMKDLHLLPKVRDGWTYLYVEHCRIEQDDKAISLHDVRGRVPVPCAMLATIMVGPGVTITQAAVKVLAEHGCLLVWCGEEGTRFYAQGIGETPSSANLLPVLIVVPTRVGVNRAQPDAPEPTMVVPTRVGVNRGAGAEVSICRVVPTRVGVNRGSDA